MHLSAKEYGKLFFETYCGNNFSGKTILDIGAQDVNGSLKEVAPKDVRYVGVDFVEGKGVDVILSDPYKLPFDNESVDAIVCSSVFEHSEFFWLLFLECIRILKPQGLLYINAPSNGFVHRYPVDSWRFYPDAGRALIKWAQRNGYDPLLLESFIGQKNGPITSDGMWNDFVSVILKDQANKSLYPHRIIDNQQSIYCGYNSNVDDDFPMFIQNPDHKLIIEQKDEIISLNQAIASLGHEIARLNQMVLERDTQINGILSSSSWRLTHLLRYIRKVFK